MTTEPFRFTPALCGWLGIDDIQIGFAAQYLPFAKAAPGLVRAHGRDAVLLYKAWSEVLGQPPDYPAQTIGDCVGQGHAHANDLLQCIEIATGKAAEFQSSATEFIYACSREVAGILGPQDGSYGSAAVKAMQDFGMVCREAYGERGTYDGKRAKRWGQSGAPQQIKDDAKPFLLGNAARVTTWEELAGALTNGYPVTICTALGFSLKRDKDGFCKREGKWGHCMFLAGIRHDREGACCVQSWGADVPSGPLALDQPTYSFWIEKRDVEAILHEGDSWALSGAPDFKPRALPSSWNWGLAA